MSEVVGVSRVERRRVVHRLVVRGERVGVVVVKASAVVLLVGDQVARKKPVDGERVVCGVAGRRGRAEVHLVELHRRSVAVEG